MRIAWYGEPEFPMTSHAHILHQKHILILTHQRGHNVIDLISMQAKAKKELSKM